MKELERMLDKERTTDQGKREDLFWKMFKQAAKEGQQE